MALEETKEGSPAYVENDAVSAEPLKKATFGQKVKRHCSRFWWLDFLIFSAVVLIIILPIVYVGYPNLAQDKINGSRLNITSMSMTEPGPDSFQLNLDAVLDPRSDLKPKLREWNGSLSLSEDDPPFAYVTIPARTARKGTVFTIDQRVQVVNMTEFTRFVGAALGTEQFSMYLSGKGDVKLGGLPTTDVHYRKTLWLQGFNALAGFGLTSFNILTSTQPDGANANGTIFIPNPTNITVELGTVTLSMSVDDVPVGEATIESLKLVPGDNEFPMRAVTNQTAVVGLIFGQYPDGVIPIDVVGNTTTNSAGQTLSYYQVPLAMNTLRLNLDVIDALDRAGLAGLLGLNTTSTNTTEHR